MTYVVGVIMSFLLVLVVFPLGANADVPNEINIQEAPTAAKNDDIVCADLRQGRARIAAALAADRPKNGKDRFDPLAALSRRDPTGDAYDGADGTNCRAFGESPSPSPDAG